MTRIIIEGATVLRRSPNRLGTTSTILLAIIFSSDLFHKLVQAVAKSLGQHATIYIDALASDSRGPSRSQIETG